ncbi:hypothetical protein [Roseobacter sp. OBYS 0001]|nr:hypothetical protein [Roseobacter sp. OBYS 0001]
MLLLHVWQGAPIKDPASRQWRKVFPNEETMDDLALTSWTVRRSND